MRSPLPVLLVLVLVSACGGDGSGSTAAGQVPDCAEAKPIEAPKQFPKDFPLPAGTVVTFGGFSPPAHVFISAVSPGDLDAVGFFLRTELERRGYRNGRGDSEPGEVEAPFTGNGYRGAWRVNAIRDCEGAVTVKVILVRQP